MLTGYNENIILLISSSFFHIKEEVILNSQSYATVFLQIRTSQKRQAFPNNVIWQHCRRLQKGWGLDIAAVAYRK